MIHKPLQMLHHPSNFAEASGPNSWILGCDTRSYSQKYAQGLQKRKKLVDLLLRRSHKTGIIRLSETETQIDFIL